MTFRTPSPNAPRHRSRTPTGSCDRTGARLSSQNRSGLSTGVTRTSRFSTELRRSRYSRERVAPSCSRSPESTRASRCRLAACLDIPYACATWRATLRGCSATQLRMNSRMDSVWGRLITQLRLFPAGGLCQSFLKTPALYCQLWLARIVNLVTNLLSTKAADDCQPNDLTD